VLLMQNVTLEEPLVRGTHTSLYHFYNFLLVSIS
jgi:hypothetical protein